MGIETRRERNVFEVNFTEFGFYNDFGNRLGVLTVCRGATLGPISNTGSMYVDGVIEKVGLCEMTFQNKAKHSTKGNNMNRTKTGQLNRLK